MTPSSSGPPVVIFYLIALLLGGVGLIFLIAAAQGNSLIRLVIAGGCLTGAAALIYLSRLRPIQNTHVHKMELDLPGEVKMKSFECKACGATLDSTAVKVVAGAIQVDCPYCGTAYQMEEQTKW